MLPAMKGAILAGGIGTRLYPLTNVTNKHLLPVYDRPMIYYPIETLTGTGIKDIMIVTGKEHAGSFMNILGSGKEFNARFSYALQDRAGGIAEALSLTEEFVREDSVLAILGDNIIMDDIRPYIGDFRSGAISGTEVLRLAKLVHGERQLIIGSRWLKESKVNKHQPLVRKLLSRGFNVLTFAVLGLKLRDTQCGLKAFPISVKQEVIPHIGTKNLFFDVSFIFNCKIRNYDIHEVGIEWSDVEDSKLRIFTTVIVFLVYLFGLRLANSKYSSLFAPYYTKFRWLYEPSHNK